jgi:plastocyanin
VKRYWSLVVLTGLTAACGSSTTTPAASAFNITISNFSFSPLNLTVPPGATVNVTNNDGLAHSVTSEAVPLTYTPGSVNGVSFDTGPFTGQTSFTIPSSAPNGTVIPYYCSVHKGAMNTRTALITVSTSVQPDGGVAPDGGTTAPDINISNLSFSPLILAAVPGATVTVTNSDSATTQHSVTSESTPGNFTPGSVNGISFDTGPFTGQKTFSLPTTAPVGTVIPYYCSVHKSTMKTQTGFIFVTGVITGAGLPDGGVAPDGGTMPDGGTTPDAGPSPTPSPY